MPSLPFRARTLWVAVAAYCLVQIGRGLLGLGGEAPAGAESPAPSALEEVPVPRGYRLAATVRALVTAYEPSAISCGAHADGRTATGRDASIPDGVAVAPAAIPYGSLVHIPGVGYRRVDDTGGAMETAWRERGQIHIDVRMRSVAEARAWGVKRDMTVHVFAPVAQARALATPR